MFLNPLSVKSILCKVNIIIHSLHNDEPKTFYLLVILVLTALSSKLGRLLKIFYIMSLKQKLYFYIFLFTWSFVIMSTMCIGHVYSSFSIIFLLMMATKL